MLDKLHWALPLSAGCCSEQLRASTQFHLPFYPAHTPLLLSLDKPSLCTASIMVSQTLLAQRNSGRFVRSSLDESSVDEQKLMVTDCALRRYGANYRGYSASQKRWKTFWTPFRYLQNLKAKQVDDFMASYIIYNNLMTQILIFVYSCA